MVETSPQDSTPPASAIPQQQRKKPKTWAIALLAAGLLAVPAGIYLVRNQSQGQPEIVETLTVPVKAENLLIRITASGEVQPIQRVNLSPKNQGRLAQLYVEQGDRVQADQVVARMESRDQEAQLRQSLARL
ncbi:MAG: biotin/lipoyl-binding protein, partial [Cyanobacteriota bacterium]|nr:biotin/lipoyl-binding protein [Cyanobacteriota bacterium]